MSTDKVPTRTSAGSCFVAVFLSVTRRCSVNAHEGEFSSIRETKTVDLRAPQVVAKLISVTLWTAICP
jgi:hypothetical protein